MEMFRVVEVEQISRTENYRANILARIVATSDAKIPKLVIVKVKNNLSIEQEVNMMNVSTGNY